MADFQFIFYYSPIYDCPSHLYGYSEAVNDRLTHFLKVWFTWTFEVMMETSLIAHIRSNIIAALKRKTTFLKVDEMVET